MSDYQGCRPALQANPARLQICLFSFQARLSAHITKLLNSKYFELKCFDSVEELANFALANYEQIDCLVLTSSDRLELLWEKLWQVKVLLPTVIVEAELASFRTSRVEQQTANNGKEFGNIYHEAEIQLYPTQLKEINSYINLAIHKFMSLAPNAAKFYSQTPNESKTAVQRSFLTQQRRLAEKLKRLSCLGFFYKRNSQHFWHNLDREQQTELIREIKQEYRHILLLYFDSSIKINKLIDEFVDRAFFANISTSQILEIHMDLIDDFSHQLKIEGRNDDVLLDYRLPLIDIVSHLCEIYRRSIPDTDTSMNLLFAVE